jgi:hypothetical protein
MQTGCFPALSHTANSDTFRLDFEANRKQAHVGEPVSMRFTVTNTGQRPLVYETPDEAVMDITVQVVGGETLLVWSQQNPDKVSHRLEWQPGESKVIEWTWTPKPGDIYTGDYHDVFLTGLLRSNIQFLNASSGVRICASIWCR